MESISVVKISSKGQIVLPKSIRNKFAKDDDIVFIDDGTNINLRKSSDVLEDLNYLKFQKETFKELEKYEGDKESYEALPSKEFITLLKSKIK
jgi:AbrB family looped-hinge helix DNA binding protein